MAVKNNQLENSPRVLSAGAAPNVNAGQGAFYPKDVSGIAEGFYKDDQGNEIQLTNNGSINVAGLGENNTASNVGVGVGEVFKQKTGVDLEFRKIRAGSNVTIAIVGDDIEISAPAPSGEVNTGSNVGTGNQVFKQKSGTDLQFRTITAGSNVTIVSSTDEITISAAGGGGSSLQVQDEGSLIDNAVTTLNFTGTGVTATQTSPGVVQIAVSSGGGGEANTASNLGAGEGLFTTKSGVNLPFKSLVAGTNVSLSSDSNTITINSTGGGGASVDDGAYPTGWDSDTTNAPSRNAVFDKIDSMDTLISANTAKVSASGSIATHSDVDLTGAVDGHALIRTGGVWTSTPLAGGGDLVSTNNLSDVANAATALSNLSGLDATNIVPQAEAEAGTATTARAWTAERVKQAIDALGGGGGSAEDSQEFVITLPSGGSLAARIGSATVPSGWSLSDAQTIADPQFGSDANDLVITWDAGLGSKAAIITYVQISTDASTFTGGQRVLQSSHSSQTSMYANSAGTRAFIDMNGIGVNNTLNAKILVKLI